MVTDSSLPLEITPPQQTPRNLISPYARPHGADAVGRGPACPPLLVLPLFGVGTTWRRCRASTESSPTTINRQSRIETTIGQM